MRPAELKEMLSWRWARVGLLVAVVVSGMCGAPAGAEATIPPVEGGPGEVTALHVTTAGPPRYVYGSDGRQHVDYDLVITNAFTAPVTLESLTVVDMGRTLLHLAGNQLADHTHQIIADKPSAEIPASATVVTLVDIVLPHSDGRIVPRRLANRVHYTVPPAAKFRALIGSTTVFGPVLSTAPRPPVEIASPLRGSGWVDANGCCDDPTSLHRNFVLSADGTYAAPELFAIDWAQEVDGSFWSGDGKQLTDYPDFGAPIYAVANGTVTSTVNDRPEVPPGGTSSGNPTVRKPQDFGGNEVIEKIGDGVYAAYEHFQTGSIVVHRGERLRAGQEVGAMGNTGNSDFPHLHFGIQDGPSPITSNALPFEIDHSTLEGNVTAGSTPTKLVIAGPAESQRRSCPLIGSVFSFSAG